MILGLQCLLSPSFMLFLVPIQLSNCISSHAIAWILCVCLNLSSSIPKPENCKYKHVIKDLLSLLIFDQMCPRTFLLLMGCVLQMCTGQLTAFSLRLCELI